MFKKKVKLNGAEALNLLNGCFSLSKNPDVKPLVTYRMTKNVEQLRPIVASIEEEKKIVLAEHVLFDADGKMMAIGNEYVFISPDEKAEAIRKLEEVYNHKNEVLLWHFEAPCVAREDGKIDGDVWVLVDKIIVDDESIVD